MSYVLVDVLSRQKTVRVFDGIDKDKIGMQFQIVQIGLAAWSMPQFWMIDVGDQCKPF